MLAYSFAQPQNESEIRELLLSAELPEEDIAPHLRNFLVAQEDGTTIGCVGLEIAGNDAMLRSLAVRKDAQSRGIGDELCRKIEALAIEQGYNTLYLLTTTASRYFERRGYQRIDRSKAPSGIATTRQFQSLCPSSAVLMRKPLRSNTGA